MGEYLLAFNWGIKFNTAQMNLTRDFNMIHMDAGNEEWGAFQGFSRKGENINDTSCFGGTHL